MAESRPLGRGEKAALGLVGVCTLFCLQFPLFTAPALKEWFAGFPGELPELTELALSGWFPLMLGLNPASVAFYAVSGPHPLGRRRLFLGVSVAMALGACALLGSAFAQR